MKYIKLTQDQYAIVDNENYSLLNHFKWHVIKLKNSFYVGKNSKIKNGEHENIRMHWIILGKPYIKMLEIDHINGNTLDNRKSNLRIVSREQNQHNQKIRNHTSIYKGVYWKKTTKKWVAQIHFENKKHHIGLFKKETYAALAYNVMALYYFGKYTKLNII